MTDPREVMQDTGAVGGSVPDDTHGIATRGREMTDEAPVSGQRQGPAVPSGRVQCAEVGARVPVSLADPREVEALFGKLEHLGDKSLHVDVDYWGYLNVGEIARDALTALRALVAERDELRGKIDEEHDTDETLLAALITATLCRLPVEIVGDGEWERYREEHGKRWMGDHRAFGGWLSGRITDALESLTAQLAAARADVERLDWLEREACHQVRLVTGDGAAFITRWGRRYSAWSASNLRAAIDAATGGA